MKVILTLLLAMALAMASSIPGGPGLCSHRGDRVRVSRSLGPKHQVPNWPCSLSFSSCPSRIRLRLGTVVPDEGAKQQPLGTERQTSDLPYPLGHFWEYLAQDGGVWMLRRSWEAIRLLGVAQLAKGLWRKAKRLRRQVSDRDRCAGLSSSPGKLSSMSFTVPLRLLLSGNRPVGLSFRGDRPPGTGRSK